MYDICGEPKYPISVLSIVKFGIDQGNHHLLINLQDSSYCDINLWVVVYRLLSPCKTWQEYAAMCLKYTLTYENG